jgi:hypothetical protein
MIKLLFWLFVAIDAAGLILWFVLGLAAAGSAKTNPLLVALLLLVLPAIPLVGSVWLFLRSGALIGRAIAFALAAAPLVIAFATKAYITAQVSANSNAQGELTFFRAGPQRELVEALRRNDSAAVTALAPTVDVNASGMDDMTPLVAALRQLRQTPTQTAALKALIAAGVDPNKGTEYETPLEMTLQIDDKSGPEPVELLLKAGANPNLKNSSGMPIYFAAAGFGSPVSTLALVLQHGADLRAMGPKQESVLIYAATAQNWKAARYLIEQGADITLGRSFNGQTFAEVVRAAEEMQRNRAAYDGKPTPDDGLQELAILLRGK